MTLTLFQALFLAVLQGISELFPVSSLAQVTLMPALFHWRIDQSSMHFLAFVVALHLATAIALVVYFWSDWRIVLLAFAGSIRRGKLVYDEQSKFAWLLVAGTIIVGALGLLFEKPLQAMFEKPRFYPIIAALLIVNGLVMVLGDAMKRRSERLAAPAEDDLDTLRGAATHPLTAETTSAAEPVVPAAAAATLGEAVPHRFRRAEELSFAEGTLIGAAQSLALLAGISRSGVTIVAGLWAGLSYEQASRFAFMLATPIIGLAALRKVPELFKPELKDMRQITLLAFVVAGVTAYLSVRFLMRYFENHRLTPFAFYCVLFGIASLILLHLG